MSATLNAQSGLSPNEKEVTFEIWHDVLCRALLLWWQRYF